MSEQTWHGACTHVERKAAPSVATVTAKVILTGDYPEAGRHHTIAFNEARTSLPSIILCDVCADCYRLCSADGSVLGYQPSRDDPRRGVYSVVHDA